jgi:hypothetical protein
MVDRMSVRRVTAAMRLLVHHLPCKGQNSMVNSVLHPQTGKRVTLRPCSGRRAEPRARRHVLRQIDRALFQIEPAKQADSQLISAGVASFYTATTSSSISSPL